MTLHNGAHRFPLGALLAALALGTSLVRLGTVERAEAHPLGNFTTNRYARLELYRGQVRLVYALDFAEIPTFQLGDSLDTDGDGNRSPEELAAFARHTAEALPAGFFEHGPRPLVEHWTRPWRGGQVTKLPSCTLAEPPYRCVPRRRAPSSSRDSGASRRFASTRFSRRASTPRRAK